VLWTQSLSCLWVLKPSELRDKVAFVRLWVQSHQRNSDKLVDDTGTQCHPWLAHKDPSLQDDIIIDIANPRCVYMCVCSERERERESAESWHIHVSQSRRCFQCRLWGLSVTEGNLEHSLFIVVKSSLSRLNGLFTCLR